MLCVICTARLLSCVAMSPDFNTRCCHYEVMRDVRLLKRLEAKENSGFGFEFEMCTSRVSCKA